MIRFACRECGGTGIDQAKTMDARKEDGLDSKIYIRCWHCGGNGLEPRFDAPKKVKVKKFSTKP